MAKIKVKITYIFIIINNKYYFVIEHSFNIFIGT